MLSSVFSLIDICQGFCLYQVKLIGHRFGKVFEMKNGVRFVFNDINVLFVGWYRLVGFCCHYIWLPGCCSVGQVGGFHVAFCCLLTEIKFASVCNLFVVEKLLPMFVTCNVSTRYIAQRFWRAVYEVNLLTEFVDTGECKFGCRCSCCCCSLLLLLLMSDVRKTRSKIRSRRQCFFDLPSVCPLTSSLYDDISLYLM